MIQTNEKEEDIEERDSNKDFDDKSIPYVTIRKELPEKRKR